MSDVAMKDNHGKIRYDLVPTLGLRKLAQVYTFGAKKYNDFNWLKGGPWRNFIQAMQRHIERFRAGEDTDPESGIDHLAHAAWHCMTLMEFRVRCPKYDDRVKEIPEPDADETQEEEAWMEQDRAVADSLTEEAQKLGMYTERAPVVYLAAPWQYRDSMIEQKKYLEDIGITVNSTWLSPEDTDDLTKLANEDEKCREVAERDLAEIDAADAVIVYSYAEMHGRGSGGRHVELGYALARGKRVIGVGTKENVFHRLGQIEWTTTTVEASRLILKRGYAAHQKV